MTLADACLLLHEMGHVATCLHRDHLCEAEWSHTWSECPAAPRFALSALDLAPITTAEGLRCHLLARRALLAVREPAP